MSTEPDEIARFAAQWIRDHGLVKQRLLDPDTGATCFNGAVLVALDPSSAFSEEAAADGFGGYLWRNIGLKSDERTAEHVVFDAITSAAKHLLMMRYGVPADDCDPARWNNAHERTPEEVAYLLDEVARVLSHG